MTLLLSESDFLSLASMPETVECIENCFLNMKDQTAENFPRTRARSPSGSLQVMYTLLPYLGRSGSKLYTVSASGAKFVILLFDVRSGELLSVMGARNLGKYRTGAASAVATKYLTGLKSFKLAMAGTGGQSLTQITAQMQIANIESVHVWSPTREHREAFAKEVSRNQGLDCHAEDTVENAFRRCDVATAITTAKDPFITKKVAEGPRHINACGANGLDRAELFTNTLEIFDTICVDDKRQAKMEAKELNESVTAGKYTWEDFVELKDIVQSKVKPGKITFFKSLGIATEDIALSSLIYDKAIKSGEFENKQFRFF